MKSLMRKIMFFMLDFSFWILDVLFIYAHIGNGLIPTRNAMLVLLEWAMIQALKPLGLVT